MKRERERRTRTKTNLSFQAVAFSSNLLSLSLSLSSLSNKICIYTQIYQKQGVYVGCCCLLRAQYWNNKITHTGRQKKQDDDGNNNNEGIRPVCRDDVPTRCWTVYSMQYCKYWWDVWDHHLRTVSTNCDMEKDIILHKPTSIVSRNDVYCRWFRTNSSQITVIIPLEQQWDVNRSQQTINLKQNLHPTSHFGNTKPRIKRDQQAHCKAKLRAKRKSKAHNKSSLNCSEGTTNHNTNRILIESS